MEGRVDEEGGNAVRDFLLSRIGNQIDHGARHFLSMRFQGALLVLRM